jgi:hypothetical protein
VAKGQPEVCKAFPASLVTDFRNEFPVIECGWSVEIGVSGGAMTGGFAGVQTDRDIGVYKMFKEVQQQLIKTYGPTSTGKNSISSSCFGRSFQW